MQASTSGDLAQAGSVAWSIYEKYQRDYNAGQAIGYYRTANYLNKTIELYRHFQPLLPDTVVTLRHANLVNAFYDLGHYEEALQEIEKFPHSIIPAHYAYAHLRLLTKMDRWEELDEKLAFYKDQPLQYSGFYHYVGLIGALCTDLHFSDSPKLDTYLDLFEQWLQETEPEFLFYSTWLHTYHYLRGNWEEGLKASRILWEKYRLNLFDYTGVFLLKLGCNQEVDQHIAELKQRPHTRAGATTYSLAVIEAYRDPALAVELLKKAINEGWHFDWYSFRNDCALMDALRNYPPFMELTEPK